MKNIYLLKVMLICFILSGCASIASSSSENVLFGSNVDNVEITIRNRKGVPVYSGKTPTTISLDKSDGYFRPEKYSVSASKKGYGTQMMTLGTRVSGWYWGNIIFGGLIGILIVDPATGAMWTFDDDKVFFNMKKTGETEDSEPKEVYVKEQTLF